ncbi:MAG: YihA family ribosome biogenesis GTP-binding protein [Polyangiaceae bacterium]|nr:YihA family ribosome biogenesis GTP-binding protein [Polyangiaceae bacterium]
MSTTSTGSRTAPQTTPYDALDAAFEGAIGVGSDPTSLPLTSVEVAFAGRSNVGKSSLINTLVQRKGLVRTSSTPGCTRQINFFSIRARDGFSLVCVDLPGYGFAKRSKGEREQWATLIEGYLQRRPMLRALVLLVDVRRGLEEDDRELLDFVAKGRVKGAGRVETVVVATKVDKLPKSKVAGTLEALRKQARRPVVGFSSETRAGYVELWKAIRHALGPLAIDSPANESPAIEAPASEQPAETGQREPPRQM